MNIIRPGGVELSHKAYIQSGLPRKARILDVGSGEGDALSYLNKEFEAICTGIDLSAEMISRAREKYKGIEFKEGDAELLDFASKSFNGVFMECSLSLVNLQIEALHEAYCVLKDGGKLIITDLFAIDPNPQEVLKMQREAMIAKNKPREGGECEDREKVPSGLMLGGAFVTDALIEACEEIGFELLLLEDETERLQGFVAEMVMEHGSLDNFFASMDEGCFLEEAQGGKTGYFLMVLEK